jgi:chorismate mutase
MKKCLLTSLCCALPFIAQASITSSDTAILTAQMVEDEIVVKIDGVLNAIQELFSTMHNVAKWKWNHRSAIEDMEKEKQLLEKWIEKGAQLGLPEEIVKEVFNAQLEAMKMIQINYFENWKRDGVDQFADVHDFKTELRPRIERISENLMMQLKEVMPLLRKKNLGEVIKWRSTVLFTDEAIDDSIRDTALQPLLMFSAQVTMAPHSFSHAR